ncbi:hypothetical protein CRENBAI_003333 [Crenichthys baileyi]|uniref:Uncharacterized protein n=1 Tax=Crenichthys baileyi TaxID=28760 RepID=A0AAV9SM56_9TELE
MRPSHPTGVNPNTRRLSWGATSQTPPQPSPPPLPVANSRVEEMSSPSKEMGSRAHAMRGGEPDYFLVDISQPPATSSGSFPPSERVTFHVLRASLSIRGSGPLVVLAHWGMALRLSFGPSPGGGPAPGPARSNPATRRSPNEVPTPGLAPGVGGHQLRRTGRRHVPRYICPSWKEFSKPLFV